jgi:hypothetical protein
MNEMLQIISFFILFSIIFFNIMGNVSNNGTPFYRSIRWDTIFYITKIVLSHLMALSQLMEY